MNLETALRELDLAFPPEPDVASRVAARLHRPFWRRRPWLVAVVAAVLAAAVAFAVPPARSAILDFFGLRGATIEVTGETVARDPDSGRPLGRPVSAGEAREAVGFVPLLPPEDVSLFLDARLPAVTASWDGGRLLLTQFRGRTTPFVRKSVAEADVVEPVGVQGNAGYWVEGAHRVLFEDARGRVLESRVAGDVLLWEQEGLTLRLEGAETKDEALRTAGTLRPVPG